MCLYRMTPSYRGQPGGRRNVLFEIPVRKDRLPKPGESTTGGKKYSAVAKLARREFRAIVISVAGLVDAFDAQDAGNFADIDEDGFELALVGNFEIGVNARVGAVGAALEVVNVGTGAADNGGDFGEKAGAVACADG